MALLGTNEWRFGYWREGIVCFGVARRFAFVGIGVYGEPDRGWFLERIGDFGGTFPVLPVYERRIVGVPLIDLALLAATLGFISWRHESRKLPGFCRVCKYNLTGNVSGTCPECGTAVSPETE